MNTHKTKMKPFAVRLNTVSESDIAQSVTGHEMVLAQAGTGMYIGDDPNSGLVAVRSAFNVASEGPSRIIGVSAEDIAAGISGKAVTVKRAGPFWNRSEIYAVEPVKSGREWKAAACVGLSLLSVGTTGCGGDDNGVGPTIEQPPADAPADTTVVVPEPMPPPAQPPAAPSNPFGFANAPVQTETRSASPDDNAVITSSQKERLLYAIRFPAQPWGDINQTRNRWVHGIYSHEGVTIDPFSAMGDSLGTPDSELTEIEGFNIEIVSTNPQSVNQDELNRYLIAYNFLGPGGLQLTGCGELPRQRKMSSSIHTRVMESVTYFNMQHADVIDPAMSLTVPEQGEVISSWDVIWGPGLTSGDKHDGMCLLNTYGLEGPSAAIPYMPPATEFPITIFKPGMDPQTIEYEGTQKVIQ